MRILGFAKVAIVLLTVKLWASLPAEKLTGLVIFVVAFTLASLYIVVSWAHDVSSKIAAS